MSSMMPEPSSSENAPLVLAGYSVDRSDLPQQHVAALRNWVAQIARKLSLLPQSTITVSIKGHTDSTGSEKHNTALGLNRAIGVRRLLEQAVQSHLVARVRYIETSSGEFAPAVPNASPTDRAQNRRVELRWKLVAPAPKPPVPAQKRPKPPHLETFPCLEFQGMRSFHTIYLEFLSLGDSSRIYFDGSRMVLSTARKKSDLEEATESTGKGLMQSIGEEFANAPKYFAAMAVADAAASISEARTAELLSGNPHDPAYRRKKLVLIAQKIADKHHFKWWELLADLGRYQKLMWDCNESRGLVKPYPELKQVPVELLRRRAKP